MTVDTLIATYKIACFFHFTDTRNLPLIREAGALLSLRALREQGIVVPAPGGSDTSQQSDVRSGMDRYVHLCLFDQNPMEYRAREDGRIEDSRFLIIDVDVLRIDGVRFTATMANTRGTQLLTPAEAAEALDLDAIYGRLDWSDRTQMQRVLRARKYELLVPHSIPARYIRNL